MEDTRLINESEINSHHESDKGNGTVGRCSGYELEIERHLDDEPYKRNERRNVNAVLNKPKVQVSEFL